MVGSLNLPRRKGGLAETGSRTRQGAGPSTAPVVYSGPHLPAAVCEERGCRLVSMHLRRCRGGRGVAHVGLTGEVVFLC